jgi:hypothetical protein
MTTLAEIDGRTPARAIVDAVQGGAHGLAVDQIKRLSRSELTTVVLLLASIVDVGDPLCPPEPSGLSHATVDTLTAAANAVCALYKVGAGELYGRSTRRAVVNARHVVCLIGSWSGLPAAEIGRVIDRDHTTVLHAIQRADNDVDLSAAAHRIMHRLQNGPRP